MITTWRLKQRSSSARNRTGSVISTQFTRVLRAAVKDLSTLIPTSLGLERGLVHSSAPEALAIVWHKQLPSVCCYCFAMDGLDYRTAHMLIQRHATMAETTAYLRIRAMEQKGDGAGKAAWTRVLMAIKTLRRMNREAGKALQ